MLAQIDRPAKSNGALSSVLFPVVQLVAELLDFLGQDCQVGFYIGQLGLDDRTGLVFAALLGIVLLNKLHAVDQHCRK